MDALGKTMHLQLTRNDQFMSPALLAETRHEDGTITTVPVSEKNYFLGKLTTDDDSLVAVRKNNGLVSGTPSLLDVTRILAEFEHNQ